MSYIPHTDTDRERMLSAIGAESISELFEQIPPELLLSEPLNISGPMSEMELARHAVELSRRNVDLLDHVSFLGAGIYDHYIPAAVRAIIGRSEFYTSYTPYQPELSQGNLQAIFEFQSMVCELMGMEVANASMYDGATALAEAALMATGITGRSEWLVSDCVHPSYRETMRTYAWASGCTVVEAGRSGIVTNTDDLLRHMTDQTACVIMQHPNFFGAFEPVAEIEPRIHDQGAMYIVSVDPISLGILKPPGEYGADICTAEGQSLGISQGFGGPLLGLFACKREYVRQMPGRLVGATTDEQGRRGYTLTLQTREQHIRRERATSNICTNEALLALAAAVYLSILGKSGLRRAAEICIQTAHYAADRISSIPGCEIPFDVRFFKEFVVKSDRPIQEINQGLLDRKIVGGLDLERFYPDLAGHVLICTTEKRTRADIESLVEGLSI